MRKFLLTFDIVDEILQDRESALSCSLIFPTALDTLSLEISPSGCQSLSLMSSDVCPFGVSYLNFFPSQLLPFLFKSLNPLHFVKRLSRIYIFMYPTLFPIPHQLRLK